MTDTFVAPLELKLADPGVGTISGYGAVFGNIDSHGDVILPGAFAASLAEHKARGTMPHMYVQHGPAMGGDPLPAGVWSEIDEDDRGLKMLGKISALDTDYGRRVRGLVQDGALRGMSIGFNVPPNGAIYGKGAGGARRTLKSVRLVEVSLVHQPSNDRARVENIKARLAEGDVPTQREVEAALREQFGLSRSQAAAFAAGGYKSLIARESGEGEAMTDEAKAAVADLRGLLGGFSLNLS